MQHGRCLERACRCTTPLNMVSTESHRARSNGRLMDHPTLAALAPLRLHTHAVDADGHAAAATALAAAASCKRVSERRAKLQMRRAAARAGWKQGYVPSGHAW